MTTSQVIEEPEVPIFKTATEVKKESFWTRDLFNKNNPDMNSTEYKVKKEKKWTLIFIGLLLLAGFALAAQQSMLCIPFVAMAIIMVLLKKNDSL